jgi:shikimate 5-dehydrogenase
MSTIELKNLVISKISEINDEAFLAAINTILDSKSESVENYNLDLKKSEDDIAQGNVSTHNQVLEKIAQWKKR